MRLRCCTGLKYFFYETIAKVINDSNDFKLNFNRMANSVPDSTIRIPFIIAFSITIEKFIFNFWFGKCCCCLFLFYFVPRWTCRCEKNRIRFGKQKKSCYRTKKHTVNEMKIVNFNYAIELVINIFISKCGFVCNSTLAPDYKG